MSATPFAVLTADPPWPFEDKLPGPGRGAERNYPVMTIEDICALPLPTLADDAWLFLWRVSSMVEEAYRVCRAWGFEPKTERVWLKLTKNGKPWFGMGRSFRAAHETVIVGQRGRPARLTAAMRTTFVARVPVGPDGRYLHSGKPELFYDQVQRFAAGPYCELFARRQRPGWTCMGDEVPQAQRSVPLLRAMEGAGP